MFSNLVTFALSATPPVVDLGATMSTAFQKVATDTITIIGDLAPIALSIFAMFFLWNKGKDFFKSMGK